MAGRDKASNQLEEFKRTQGSPDTLTTGICSPVGNKTAAMTVGPRGPLLIPEFVFTDEMEHFNWVLSKALRDNLKSNIAGHLIGAQEFIQKRVVGNFVSADPVYGRMIQEKIDKLKAQTKGASVPAH